MVDTYNQTLNEGLNLAKKRYPDWRYFELRICPWGWNDLRICPWGWNDDECDGDWDFIYFKLKGADIKEIDYFFGEHDHDSMFIILRTALMKDVIQKYMYDLAAEIVELSQDEYCTMTNCEEEDLMEGLNLQRKTNLSDLDLVINNLAYEYGLISEGLNLQKKETMDQVELPNIINPDQKQYAKVGYRVGWIDNGKFRYGTVYQIFQMPNQETVVVIQPEDISDTMLIELPINKLITGVPL